MKKLFIFFGMILLGFYLYSNFKDITSRPVATPQAPLSASAPKARPSKQSVQKIIPDDWPGISQNENAIILEDNLTRKNIILIFDGSGSMGKVQCSGTRTKNDVAKDAVKEWAASIPEDANLGLIVFDQQGLSVRLPLGLNNKDRFRQEIGKIIPNYKTPLTASLGQAYTMLTVQGIKQLGYGEYSIVIVTDGVANNPDNLTQSVNSIIASSPIMISTIGFCIQSSHSLNQSGKTIYKSASDPASLRKGLKEVLAESESFDISAFQ